MPDDERVLFFPPFYFDNNVNLASICNENVKKYDLGGKLIT
jgi:hypothetical protein